MVSNDDIKLLYNIQLYAESLWNVKDTDQSERNQLDFFEILINFSECVRKYSTTIAIGENNKEKILAQQYLDDILNFLADYRKRFVDNIGRKDDIHSPFFKYYNTLYEEYKKQVKCNKK